MAARFLAQWLPLVLAMFQSSTVAHTNSRSVVTLPQASVSHGTRTVAESRCPTLRCSGRAASGAPLNSIVRHSMDTVFVVHHSYLVDDDASSEETKLIGVYSTQSKAQNAV